MYLIDTNIISAVAPSKAAAPAALVDWMDQASPGLYLSVVTVAEVESGVAKALREGAARKAQALREWWGVVEHLYGNRILPIDAEVAHAAGRMMDHARSKGHAPGFADIAIAATARVHGLTILSRNTRHFSPLDVPLLDPFEVFPPLPTPGRNP